MRFYLERTARAVITLWLALTLTFGIIRLMPSNPLQLMEQEIRRQNPRLSNDEIEFMVQQRAENLNMNLEAPLYEQYFDYMISLANGSLGVSFEYGRPVTEIVGEALPWTVLVMTSATILVFAIAIVWGAVMAYWEGGLFDSASSSISILASAVPFYVLAFVLILIFGYRLGWFPTGGKTSALTDASVSLSFAWDVIHHAMLPIASIVLTQAGLQTLAMRGNSIQVLGEDYVRVARLRGLSDRRISTRYVGRNAILPMYTGFLMLIGYNLGGSIILEQIFTYRGLGWYMFDALETNDYALMMGTFVVYAVALVLAVYIADLTYSKIDPRVKMGESSEAY